MATWMIDSCKGYANRWQRQLTYAVNTTGSKVLQGLADFFLAWSSCSLQELCFNAYSYSLQLVVPRSQFAQAQWSDVCEVTQYINFRLAAAGICQPPASAR